MKMQDERMTEAATGAEAGFSLIEVMIALMFLAGSTLVLLSVLAQTSENDEQNRERTIALHAAMAQMEIVLAYDDDEDINNFITQWTTPGNSTFTVDELNSPDAVGAPAPGTITIDATDPTRVGVTILIRWESRRGHTQQISLPFTKTETLQ